MGNKQSKYDFGSIFLKTEDPFYYAGQTVNGNIFLNLTKELKGPGLFLLVKGKEHMKWTNKKVKKKKVHEEVRVKK